MDAKSQNTAYISQGRKVTYHTMTEHAQDIAAKVPTRSVVLFMASNTEESLLAYVGFLRQRTIPLMVSDSIELSLLEKLITDYQPEYLWCKASYPFRGNRSWDYKGYRLWEIRHRASTEVNPDLALLLTTSGSTGSRKYVRLSYKNLESNARSIIQYLGIQESDRAITTLPFSYTYGLSIVNSHLLAGASILLTEKTMFDREFWEIAQNYEITNFGGVPYTFSILKRLRFQDIDVPSLRYITQAGGRLSEALQSEFAEICSKKGIDFYVMYGQTEGTARLAFLPPEYAQKSLGSIGKAIPGGQLFLVDDKGDRITETGVAGELFFEGDSVSMGYAECRQDLMNGNDNQGVLATGDLACFDEDGFFRIVGRKRRFLKVFGNRVNLDELEQLFAAEGFSAACCGKDDDIHVFVENSDLKEAKRIATKLSGINTSAITTHSLEALPRNDSGKIIYTVLEALC